MLSSLWLKRLAIVLSVGYSFSNLSLATSSYRDDFNECLQALSSTKKKNKENSLNLDSISQKVLSHQNNGKEIPVKAQLEDYEAIFSKYTGDISSKFIPEYYIKVLQAHEYAKNFLEAEKIDLSNEFLIEGTKSTLLKEFLLEGQELFKAKKLTPITFKHLMYKLAFIVDSEKPNHNPLGGESSIMDLYENEKWKKKESYQQLDKEAHGVAPYPFCYEMVILKNNGVLTFVDILNALFAKEEPRGLLSLPLKANTTAHVSTVNNSPIFLAHDQLHWHSIVLSLQALGDDWKIVRNLFQKIFLKDTTSKKIKAALFFLFHEASVDITFALQEGVNKWKKLKGYDEEVLLDKILEAFKKQFHKFYIDSYGNKKQKGEGDSIRIIKKRKKPLLTYKPKKKKASLENPKDVIKSEIDKLLQNSFKEKITCVESIKKNDKNQTGVIHLSLLESVEKKYQATSKYDIQFKFAPEKKGMIDENWTITSIQSADNSGNELQKLQTLQNKLNNQTIKFDNGFGFDYDPYFGLFNFAGITLSESYPDISEIDESVDALLQPLKDTYQQIKEESDLLVSSKIVPSSNKNKRKSRPSPSSLLNGQKTAKKKK